MRIPLLLDDAVLSGARELEQALLVMNEEEFRAFYERTSRPLWAYLVRITGESLDKLAHQS